MVRRRPPAVAGQFYEADPEALKHRIGWCFKHPLGPGKLPKPSARRVKESKAFMVPHAGYVFSGPVAAHAYLRIAEEGKPETFVIIGPNHTGLGSPVAVYPEGVWETPLGEVPVDADLASEVLRNSRFARADASAHDSEHSIEVQLPFLQYLFGNTFAIVPIAMLYQTPKVAEDVANALVKAVDALRRDIIIITSSDMSHYEPHEVAVRKDRMALDRILKLDPDGLYDVVLKKNITMCGVGPVMTALRASLAWGASSAELLKYATSGDVTGEKSWVVGYATVRIR